MHSFFLLAAAKAAIALTAYSNATTSSVNLFVSSYDGTVTTFSFDRSKSSLKVQSQSRDCGSNPSWLVYDKPSQVLYCLDENMSSDPSKPSSVVTSYTVNSASGQLTVTQSRNLSTTASVSGVLFGDSKFMAIAGYAGQLSALSINKTTLEQVQIFDFVNNTAPGPRDSQKGPHPHQAIVDPTGKFVIVPDLGGDLLRVFAINTQAMDRKILFEKQATKTRAGAGPRHAVFWQGQSDGTYTKGDTYLFVLFELTSTISSYRVAYPSNGELEMTEIDYQDTFGGGKYNSSAAAGEIQVSPDNQFVVVSNRNQPIWTFQRQDGSNNAWEDSDALATFAIQPNGTLAFKQIWPAGGLHPRHFAMNKAGDLVAVTLKNHCRLHILARDPSNGLISWTLAEAAVGTCNGNGGPTMVVWDE